MNIQLKIFLKIIAIATLIIIAYFWRSRRISFRFAAISIIIVGILAIFTLLKLKK
ncbi:conserved hypothetical protein [Methanothermus fervidus DSM 2088]|uniref:Uncharacterized protein n=1 Tax=Methanothermus fervidus (strain ATCC 43054 / DSM 2088 / JCM 10308 / V24 S) TaxID=523846 RepID=E3GXJ8_METFV|nr:hypothetical protein [Methanothermus fervidus]ADP77030.1 conserved hypothetical protein [Methanothermus fervidus DSM 2088]